MAILTFNFTKISVERKGALNGKISINNKFGIKSVESVAVNLGNNKKDALKYVFEFSTDYDVNGKSAASIALIADIITLEEPAVVKAVLESWKKEKKVDSKYLVPLINGALIKCNVEALVLSRELNLPSPIQLPKVNVASK